MLRVTERKEGKSPLEFSSFFILICLFSELLLSQRSFKVFLYAKFGILCDYSMGEKLLLSAFVLYRYD